MTRKYTAADAEVSRRIASLADEIFAELGEVDASQGTCCFDAIEREAVASGDEASRVLMARSAWRKSARRSVPNVAARGAIKETASGN